MKKISLEDDNEDTSIEELANVIREAIEEQIEPLVIDDEGVIEDWRENVFDFINNEF